jgi:hypothetical protein
MNENPKFEFRNPKQIRNLKSGKRRQAVTLRFVDSDFEFVSDFEIRISDLSPEAA